MFLLHFEKINVIHDAIMVMLVFHEKTPLNMDRKIGTNIFLNQYAPPVTKIPHTIN